MKIYHFTTTVPVEQVTQRVQHECQARGFGTLHTYPVQEILRSKGLEFRPKYYILSVCNPRHAKQVLEAEPLVGVVLPCRVMVYEGVDRKTHVNLPSPIETFNWLDLSSHPEFRTIATEVESALTQAIEAAVRIRPEGA